MMVIHTQVNVMDQQPASCWRRGATPTAPEAVALLNLATQRGSEPSSIALYATLRLTVFVVALAATEVRRVLRNLRRLASEHGSALIAGRGSTLGAVVMADGVSAAQARQTRLTTGDGVVLRSSTGLHREPLVANLADDFNRARSERREAFHVAELARVGSHAARRAVQFIAAVCAVDLHAANYTTDYMTHLAVT